MSRWLVAHSSLILCTPLLALSISAQCHELENTQLGQIKIESFDWVRQVSEIPKIRHYPFGLPEGKSANLPSDDLPRTAGSEKIIYRIRIRNRSEKSIASVEWCYQFLNPLTKEILASHEFKARIRIKPHKSKSILAERFSPPTPLVDINLLSLDENRPYLESAVLRSVKFKEPLKVGPR